MNDDDLIKTQALFGLYLKNTDVGESLSGFFKQKSKRKRRRTRKALKGKKGQRKHPKDDDQINTKNAEPT